MKFVLIVVIVVAFCVIGVLVYSNYLTKKNIYKCMVGFCDYSLLEIKFNKTNFKSIIEKYLDSSCLEVKNFLNSYLNNSIYNSKVLKNEENITIQNFLSSIGKKDVDGEVFNLNKYKEIFKNKLELAKEDEKKRGVASLKISIILGLLVAIILI